MGLMIDSGSPTINFGPGHMGIAHQADEDLVAATKVFALAIADLCGYAQASGARSTPPAHAPYVCTSPRDKKSGKK